jgi:DNA-binding CsgD family transcriptional regulator
LRDRRRHYQHGHARLLGRDEILREITSVLDGSWPHPVGPIVLEGKPGHGKTALLNAAAHIARHVGLEVVRARCVEGDQLHPNRLLLEILRYLDGSDLDQDAHPRDALDDRETLGALILERLASRSDGTVLIAVDDAQWIDSESGLWMLEFLCRRAHEQKVHVLVTLQPRRPGTHASALDQLVFEHNARLFTLEPLNVHDVDAFLGQRFAIKPDHAVVEQLHRQTGGVPLLLVLTINDGTQLESESVPSTAPQLSGNASIVRWILTRVTSLQDDVHSLLESVSVLGPEADFRVAAAAASLETVVAARISDQLVELDIFRPGRPLNFMYEIVRSSIYADIPVERRWEIHEFAAEVLSAKGNVELAAEHLLRTEPRNNNWAARTLTDAAREAMVSNDFERADRYAHRAVAESVGMSVPPELSLILARIAGQTGDPAVAEHLETAITQGADLVAIANTALELLDQLWEMPCQSRLLDSLSRIHDELEKIDPELALRVEVVETLAGRRTLDLPDGAEVVQLGTRRQGSDSLRGVSAALAAVDACATPNGPTFGEVMAIVRENLTIEVIARSESRWASSAIIRVLAGLVRMGATADVTPLLTLAHTEAMRNDHNVDAVKLGLLLSETHEMRGRLDQADGMLVQVMSVMPSGSPWYHAARISRAILEMLRGEPEGGQDPLDDFDFDDWRVLGPLHDAHCVEECGRLQLMRSQWQSALDAFAHAELLARARGIENPALTSWRVGRVSALVHLDEQADALDLAEQNLELARAFGAPTPIARALRALASAASAPEQRIGPLQEAVELLDGRSNVVETCLTMIDLGRAHLEMTETSSARTILRDAADMAVRIGASSLVTAAAEELHATGARPRRLHTRGSDSLTPAERRVVLLAAEGMTNGAIARSLYVSLKTVESHLARAYRKLGVKSRTELSGLLRVGDRVESEHGADAPPYSSVRPLHRHNGKPG